MNKAKAKRERRKQHRKDFHERCKALEWKARDIGFILHWSRRRGVERRISTKFSIWAPGEYGIPIVRDLSIDEVEEYIDRLSKIKVFV